jgi:hypothetical protein
MQRSYGARVPLAPDPRLQILCFQRVGFFCRPSCYGVGVGERIRPNHGAVTF